MIRLAAATPPVSWVADKGTVMLQIRNKAKTDGTIYVSHIRMYMYSVLSYTLLFTEGRLLVQSFFPFSLLRTVKIIFGESISYLT